MLVLCAVIDVEVSQDSSTETVLGEHTLDDLAEEAVRTLSLQDQERVIREIEGYEAEIRKAEAVMQGIEARKSAILRKYLE